MAIRESILPLQPGHRPPSNQDPSRGKLQPGHCSSCARVSSPCLVSRTSLPQIPISSFQPPLVMLTALGLQGEEEPPMPEHFPVPRSDGPGIPGTGWVPHRAGFVPGSFPPPAACCSPAPGMESPGSRGAVLEDVCGILVPSHPKRAVSVEGRVGAPGRGWVGDRGCVSGA